MAKRDRRRRSPPSDNSRSLTNPTLLQLDSAFAVFDKDGNGTIDPEELITILTDPKGGVPLSLEAAKVWRAVVVGVCKHAW